MESGITLQFLLGIALAVCGAEALVRGAVRVSNALAISPLLIGLTVVAFGTSAPEIGIGTRSALTGRPEIALGLVLGSNIFNVFVILGLCSIVTPLRVSPQLVRRDVPLLLSVSLLLYWLSWDGVIDRHEGGALVLLVLGYTGLLIFQSRRDDAWASDFFRAFGVKEPESKLRLALYGAAVPAGLLLLVWGAGLVVTTAESVAHGLGATELVVALTLLSMCTSLPELAVSLLASRQKESDIAVGNIVGSNIFNILAGLGLAALVAPAGIRVGAAVLSRDLPVMIAGSFLCLPFLFPGHRYGRAAGVLLLLSYAAYVAAMLLGWQGLAW